MSAIGGLSGLVLLNLSFSHFEAKATSAVKTKFVMFGMLPWSSRFSGTGLEQIGAALLTFRDDTRDYNSMCLDRPWRLITSALAAQPPRW